MLTHNYCKTLIFRVHLIFANFASTYNREIKYLQNIDLQYHFVVAFIVT